MNKKECNYVAPDLEIIRLVMEQCFAVSMQGVSHDDIVDDGYDAAYWNDKEVEL